MSNLTMYWLLLIFVNWSLIYHEFIDGFIDKSDYDGTVVNFIYHRRFALRKYSVFFSAKKSRKKNQFFFNQNQVQKREILLYIICSVILCEFTIPV